MDEHDTRTDIRWPEPGTPLPPALDGELVAFDGLSAYVRGAGPPLLLVHSVNAAASAAEVRPVFDALARTHTVFALDLPGFGFSDRSERRYDPRLMTDALHAATAQMRRLCSAPAVDALAVSLGCEFLARAAVEAPSHYARLALVSPTGLEGKRRRGGNAEGTREVPGLHALLTRPGWGPALFRQLTRPGVIRYFLERSFGSKEIDGAMWRYAVQTARAPGAWHAPLQFVAGRLFSADIQQVYEQLSMPVWMCHGIRGDFTDYGAVPLLPRLARWRRMVFLTGAMPYFERPGPFISSLHDFLREPPRAVPVAARAAARAAAMAG